MYYDRSVNNIMYMYMYMYVLLYYANIIYHIKYLSILYSDFRTEDPVATLLYNQQNINSNSITTTTSCFEYDNYLDPLSNFQPISEVV